jgi:hypothetical protein
MLPTDTNPELLYHPQQQQHEVSRGSHAQTNGGACAVGNPPASLATEEDVYGRCTNMRLTSFTETTPGATIRDPRIIDLAQCTGATSAAAAATSVLPNGGGHAMPNSHHHLPPPPTAVPNNFNTLPVHLTGGGGGGGLTNHNLAAMQLSQAAAGAIHHHHNTLPARVGESPPRALTSSAVAATGRHFKPFDHRRMNPMAEIQENPYELQVSRAS